MNESKTFAVGKLAVAVFAISAAWLFFGAIAPTSAAGTTCVWTASTSQNMSVPTNWENANDGTACTYANLVADNTTLTFTARTSTNATWDANATTTGGIDIQAGYTGVISFGQTSATATGAFSQAGGTVSTTGSGVLYVGGLFSVTDGAWAGVTGMNVALYGTTKNLTINTTSVPFYNLTIEGSYTLDGTYTVTTTNNLTVDSGATLDLSTKSLSVGGSLLNSGTITQASAGTVTMTGNSKTLGATGGSTTIYNLVIAGTPITLGEDIIVSNNLVVNSGKTLALGAFDLALAGNLANSGVVTQSAGAVTMSGAAATLGGSGITTLYDLHITGTKTTLAGSVTSTHVLTIDASKELDAGSYDLRLTGTGIPLITNGTFTANSSAVLYSGANVAIASTTYYGLDITAGTAALSANTIVGGALIVSSGATLNLGTYNLTVANILSNSGTVTQSAGAVTMSGAAVTLGGSGATTLYDLNITGTKTTLAGSVTSTHIITIDDSMELDAGIYNLALTGTGIPLTKNGTFTASTSLVIYSGATALIASSTYYNLTIGAGTGTLSANATVSNNLAVTSGATLALSTFNLALAGNLANAGTVTQASAGTVTMSGNAAFLGATGGNTTLYNLTITGNTTTLAGNVTTTNALTITADKELDAGTFNLTLSGDGIPLTKNGLFTASTSLVMYTGTAAIASSTYYNLTIGDGTGTLSANATVSNDLTVNTGAALALSTFNLALAGNFANAGTVTQSAGTVTMSGNTKTLGATGGSTTMYNLTISGTPISLGEDIIVSNDLTVNTTKTLALGAYDLALTGDLANSGIVTQSAGTVTMSGDAATLGATGGITTLYNLTIAGNTTTLANNVTSTNVLTINADKELVAGTKQIVLSKASGVPFVITGMFTASTSEVQYTGTGSVTTTAATYYKLVLGTGTYYLGDNTTSTNSFINGGTATIWAGKYLYAPTTFDNNGTITENGAIRHPLTSALITNSAGTETAAFVSASDSVYITVIDSDGNLHLSTVDTITGSVLTSASNLSDSEAVTLTETGANTGIFRSAALPLTVAAAAAANSGVLEVSSNGNLTLAFVDSKESSDTGSDTATFTGSLYSAGGSSGGSSGGGAPADTTPPTNTSVVIAAGVSTTASVAVTLTLAATDASQMMISNALDFTGSTWETYATTKTWTLTSGAGSKTVYAKFKDTTGNMSIAVSDTINSTATTTVNPPNTPPSGSGCPALVAGDMVKVTGKPAIYAVNSAMKVLYFPSGDEFKSWRPTYGGYYSITQTCFDALSVPTSYPAAVNYHPGSYVLKRASSDQLYVVEPGNKLAKITPAVATTLYGTAYTTMTVADPFWPHYVNRGTDIAAAKAQPGMLVKVGTVTYYVDANNQLREITTAGMTANGFQTRFVRTVPASAIEGLTAGVKITAEIKALTDKTQETVE
jgi:hypothetical protein